MPALSTALMLLVLLALGTWQLQRRAWKQGVLAEFAAAERNPPVALAGDVPPFAKVSVTGRLRPDLAAGYGAEVRGNVLGTQMLVPLERAGNPPLLVDLGWVADPAQASLPRDDTTVVGYIRPGDRPGWFSAADDIAHRRFYTLDPAAIGRALGLELAPFTLVALGSAPPPGAPDPARGLPELPNNHLQYAITWFALAAVLLAVFATYVRKRSQA